MVQCNSAASPPSFVEESPTMLTVEQVAAAQKSSFGTLFGFSAKAIEGIEKLAQVNLQAGKATLDELAEASRAVLALKDPQDLVALQSAAVEPTAAKWAGYAGQVYAIVAATGAELRQLAEQGAAEAQQNLVAAIEGAFKNAPAGGENAAAFVKAAFAAANAAFDNLQTAAKQVSDAADAQVQTVTASMGGTGARSRRAA
jgi:phasin family protein